MYKLVPGPQNFYTSKDDLLWENIVIKSKIWLIKPKKIKFLLKKYFLVFENKALF